jgi:hypothetical protein
MKHGTVIQTPPHTGLYSQFLGRLRRLRVPPTFCLIEASARAFRNHRRGDTLVESEPVVGIGPGRAQSVTLARVKVVRRQGRSRDEFSPMGGEALDATRSYFHNEASTVAVELDCKKVNPVFTLSSEMRQGSFESQPAKCGDELRL